MSAVRTPVRTPLGRAAAKTVGRPAAAREAALTPALTPISLAMCLLVAAPPSFGLPTGPVNTSGQATVQTTAPGQMLIQQGSAKASLDWTSFSIAAGERLQVVQPNRTSVLLNRVVGENPSLIYGSMQSNGAVWLINPRGIVFGANSRVDVGSLVASTLGISDDALRSGRLQLGAGAAGAGELRSEGSITAIDGSVVLVAPNLVHSGQIDARRVGLVAASDVLVDVEGDGLIFFNVKNDALDTRLQVLGGVRADGGSAEFRAAARAGFADTVLNLSGVVQARSFGQRQGRIVVDGGAQGITQIAGTLQATADAGAGGDVLVQGHKILLTNTAQVDTSGSDGGGRLRVGGGFQGKDDGVRNASMVSVAPGARLAANATTQGDGGELIVWSDHGTRFYGRADARGGARSGDGGLVEVSGKDFLDFRGSSDRAAPQGRAGLLLLDPTDLEIVLNTPDLNGDGTTGDDLSAGLLAFSAPGLLSRITAGAVQTQLGAGNVFLQALGNIDVKSGISAPGASALTLQAAKNITIDAPISLGGALTLSANDAAATSGRDDNASVRINQPITSTGALTVSNNGGSGVHTVAASLNAGSLVPTGDLSVTGASTWTLGAALGAANVAVANGGTLTLAAATLNGTGVVVNSGGTLTNNGANTLGTLNLAGTLNGSTALNAGSAVLTTATLATGLTLSGNATKIGAGNTLLQANLSAVNVDVNGGTLDIGTGGGVTASGAFSVASGAELAITRPGFTLGTVAGTGALRVAASGVTLGGTLAGFTSIGITGSGNSLTLANDSGDRINNAAAVNVGTGASLQLGNAGETVGTLTLAGTLATSAQVLTAGTYNLQSGAQVDAALGAGTLDVQGTSTLNAASSSLAVTVRSGATLTRTATGGDLDAGATVTVENTGVLSLAADDTLTQLNLNGTLSGAGVLSATSAALNGGNVASGLTLSGNLSSLGASTLTASVAAVGVAVNGGTLSVGNGAAGSLAASGTVTLAAGAELAYNGTGPFTLGTVAGTGNLRVSQGALTLNGNAATLSAINVDAGSLTLGGGAAQLGAGTALSVAGPGTLSLGGNGETVASLALTGTLGTAAGVLTATTYTLNANAVVDGGLGLGTLNVQGNAALNAAAAATAVNVNSGTLTLGGNGLLAGGATVTVASGATLAMGGTASINTLVLGGTVSGANALSTVDLNASINASTPVIAAPVSATNAVTVASGAVLTVGNGAAGSLDATGTLTVNTGGVLAYNRNSAITLGTNVAGGGTLRFIGGAVVNFNANANSLAALEVSGSGTDLRLGNGDSTRIGDSTAVNIGTGALLTLGTSAETVGTLDLSGTLTGGNTLSAGSYTLRPGALVSSALGNGNLSVSGNGTATLNAVKGTGSLTVNANATLELGASANLNANSDVIVQAAGTLVLGANDTIDDLTLAGTLDGAFTLTASGGTTLQTGALISAATDVAGGQVVVNGTATLAGRVDANVRVNNGGALSLTADRATATPNLSDHIGNARDVNLQNGGSMQLARDEVIDDLTGPGTLIGPGVLNAETLTLNDGESVGSRSANALISNGNTTITGAVTITGVGVANIQTGTLTVGQGGSNGSLEAGGGIVINSGAVLSFNRNNTLLLSSTVSGAGTLRQAGSAASQLQIGGVTTVELLDVTGGTLSLVNGNNTRLFDGAAVSVSSGATLRLDNLSETIASLNLGGNLAGPGTLTTSGTTALANGAAVNTALVAAALTSAGTTAINSATTAATVTVNSGTLTLAAALTSDTVNLAGGSLSTSGVDRLADTATVTVNTGSTLTLGGADTVAALSLGGNLAAGSLLTAANIALTDGATVNSGFNATAALIASGSTAINSAVTAATTSVTGGTLTLAAALTSDTVGLNGGNLGTSGANVLADTANVVVASGSTLTLGGNDSIATLALSGTLAGSGRTLSANTSTLQGNSSAAANLGAGSLVVAAGATATLSGSTAATLVDIQGTGQLTLVGASRFTGAPVMQLNGALVLGGNETLGSVAGSGSGNLGNFTLTTGSDAVNTSFGGVFSGSGGLTKVGGSTFTLAASQAYSGTTAVNGGILALSGSERLADGSSIDVGTAGTLTLAGGASTETVSAFTLAGNLAGSGTLVAGSYALNSGTTAVTTNLGAGQLTATGTSTLNGTLGGNLRVASGLLTLGSAGRLVNSASTLELQGGTLVLGGNESVATSTLAGTLNAALANTTLTATSHTLQAGSVVNADLVGTSVAVSGSSTLNGQAQVTTVTVANGGNLSLAATANRIVDTAAVDVVSGGQLTLAGDETVATLNLAGVLAGSGRKLTADTTLASGASVLANLGGSLLRVTGNASLTGTADSTALQLDGGVFTLAAPDRLAATTSVTVAAPATLLLGGNQTLAELNGAGTINMGSATLTLAPAANSTFSGSLAGGAAGSFVKQGAPGTTFTLAGDASAFTGTARVASGTLAVTGTLGALQVDVAGGTLNLGSAERLASAAVVTVGTGATLTLAGTETVGTLNLNGLLNGSGTLDATNVALNNATVASNANLGGGSLSSLGTTVLNGTSAATTLALNGGTLTLAGAGRLTAAPVTTLAGGLGTTLALQGANTLGSLAGNGTVSLGAFTLSTGSAAGNTSFGGALTGSGGLTKQGASTFTLSSAQGYGGTTTVAAGTLATGTPNVLPDAGNVSVAGGATLTLGGADSINQLTLSGTLGGNGTLTATAGTGYVLNGGTVNTALGGGGLSASGSNTLAAAAAVNAVNVAAGGTLTLTSAGHFSAAPAVTVAASGSLGLGSNQTFGSLAGSGEMALGSFTLSTGSAGPSSFVGLISGTGGLVKTGNAVFSLGGSHSYGGSTRVAQGTLALLAANVLPDASAVTVDAGATLALGGADTVASLALTGTLGGAGTLSAASHGFNAGAATLLNANLGGGTLTVGGNSSLGGTAAGDVLVNTGTLSLAAADRLADTATVTVLAPATLLLAGADTVANLVLAGRLDGAGQTLTASSTATLQAGALVDANLAGATLNINGTATLNGSAANTTINLSAGTLTLGAAERLNDSANLTVAGGTTLLLGGTETVGTLTLAGALGNPGRLLNAGTYTLQDGASVLANLGAGTLASTGAATLAGTAAANTVNVNGGTLSLGSADRLADTASVSVASGATLLLNGDDTVFRLALSGVLGGTGTLSASIYTLSGGTYNTPLGGGDLTVSANSTLNATSAATTVTVDGGTLTLGAANRFTAAPAVTVNAGTGLTLGGAESFGSLTGAGTVTLGNFTLTHLGLAVNGVNDSFSGSLGVPGDSGGFVKTGPSNFTLAGSGAYTGQTRVDAGSLTLTGTLASLAVDVDGGSLVLTAADRLADAAAVTVRNGALLTLAGNDSVGSLALTGTLGVSTGSTATLSAASVALIDGTVNANLGAGSLTSTGTSVLNGSSAATTLAVNGGTLTLAGAGRLTAAPVTTLAGGATLTMQGDLALGSLAGGGTVNLGSFTLTSGSAGNSSYGGVLLGSGGLSKVGTSVFTLGGNNSYTGATQVLAGGLATSAANVLPDASALTVAGGASLTLGGIDSVASLVLAGNLNGPGTLTAATYALNGGSASAALGGGALSSSGNSSLAAPSAATTVAVNSGTLTLAAANLLANGAALSVASGATLAMSGDDSVASLALAGTLGLTTGNTATLSATSYTLSDATVNANLGAGTLASSGSTTLAGTAGAGTVQVNGGTLNLASAARLADSAQVAVASGATLRLNGDDAIASLALAGTLSGTGRLGATTITLDGGSAVANLGATTLTSSGSSSVAGTADVGTLNVAGGRLTLAGSAALSATAATTVASGATLALGGDQALGTLAGAGNVALGGFTLTTGSGGNSRFDGVISGSGGLNKAGTGSFTLGGANSYSGATAVLTGTLATAGANVLPDASATRVASGATLQLGGDDSVATLLLNGALQGSATLTAATYTLDGGTAVANLGTGRLVSTASSTLAGSAAAAEVAVNSGTLVLAAANRLADSAAVAIASGATLQLGGDDSISRADVAGTLAGTGTLNAATVALAGGVVNANLGGGTLSSSGDSRLNATSAATTVNVDSGTLTLGSAQRLTAAPALTLAVGSSVLLNGDQTLNSLAGAGNLGLATTTLRVGSADSSSYAGSISGSGNLVKQGSGTLTLAGAHAYDGGTTVEAGTLALAAAERLPDSSAVAVATGATLALAGDEAVASLALAGTLAGNGTLRAASYALDSGNAIASLGAGALQSTGASRLAGTSAASSVAVNGGTLTLAAADRLAEGAAVAVAPGAVLTLNGNDSVASLALAGTLNGAGTLSAATYTLDSGTLLADLGAGTLRSAGNSRIDGRSAATTLAVDSGSLTLGAADRLADSMAVSVGGGAALVINASDTVASLTLAGTLSGSGTLNTTSTLMDGGRADANLGTGSLTTRGSSTLAGTATAASVVVDTGTLTLASAQRLLALPVLQVNNGATLAFAGDQAVGSLAGAGNVALGSFTLSTGSTGNSVFAGVISGSGGLIKQGSSSVFTLTGANSYTGTTRISAGTLRVGDGGSSGSLATSSFDNSGTLALVRSDDITLAQPVSGSGSVEQAGNGRVLFSGSNKTYSGDTVVSNGQLATASADELPDGSSVRVAAGARLALGGRETVRAVDADGSISLGPELVASGDLLMRGAVTTSGAVQLTGQRIAALNEGNRFGGTVSLSAGGELRLSSGVGGTGATGARDLVLGTVNAAAGGRVDAGMLSLRGVTTVSGGRLALVAAAPLAAVAPDADLTNRQAASLPIAFAADAVLAEAGGRVNVAAGAGLDVMARNGGSVQLLAAGNSFVGELSVLSGAPDSPWSANSTALAFGGATLNYAVQSRVRLAGDTVNIGGAGILADVVSLRADRVATNGSAAIVARLPFDSSAGTATALPALTLELTPAAFALSFPFGAPGAEGGLRINVGSREYGNRVLPLDAGFVTVLPRDGASGSTAVLLRGPVVNPSGGYRFFFAGAGNQTQIPVFYNGVLPTTPQVENSISATVAVSEGARKAGFDDAVRTENVAVRLRAGVIAEVGPAPSATQGTEGLRVPAACPPTTGALRCAGP